MFYPKLEIEMSKAKSKKSVNLGREGTPSRFIREQYLAGKETPDVVKALKAKFGRKTNLHKNPAQVSWYRSQMRSQGVNV